MKTQELDMKTEQWNLLGECTKCRKEKYCSKPCKAHKKNVQRKVMNAVAGSIINVLDRYR